MFFAEGHSGQDAQPCHLAFLILTRVQTIGMGFFKDHEIIELRKRVAQTASSQLDNGVITSTDYVKRVNDAIQAEIKLKTHEIQLVQAKVNYNATLGKL